MTNGAKSQAVGEVLLTYILAEERGNWRQIETTAGDVRMHAGALYETASLRRPDIGDGPMFRPEKILCEGPSWQEDSAVMPCRNASDACLSE
jgi:hypothetical protein